MRKPRKRRRWSCLIKLRKSIVAIVRFLQLTPCREFAADIMTMLSFTEPWGFVKNSRDERGILTSWRLGLDFFGFAGRFTFFRNYIMHIPVLNLWLLPKTSNDSGMGWLMAQADRHVTDREKELANGIYPDKPDFMQQSVSPTSNRAYQFSHF